MIENADQLVLEKNPEPIFYYEECLQESLKIPTSKELNTEIERYLKAVTLRYDILSIGESMGNHITQIGCKQIMIVCCHIMSLAYNTAFEAELLNKVIVQHVNAVLNIDLNQIVKMKQLSYIDVTYRSDDFFNAFDLLINLYCAFGKKDLLNCILVLIDKFSELIVADELKPRFKNYSVLTKQMLDKSWTPPKTDIKLF